MTRREVKSHAPIETCSRCKNAFRNIALHWQTHSFCDHPSYTGAEKAITIGLLIYRGYLQRSQGDSNASLVCFLEEESLSTELFNLYGPLALKVVYVTGEEFFGQPIRRSYALFLRSHPYLTEAAKLWGTGSSKSAPDMSQFIEASETTYALLYRLVGQRGFDNHDWPVFDCSQLDGEPYLLRELLSEYDSFVPSETHTRVVLKDSARFFEDIAETPIEIP